ncbi:MAG: hypothetical protein ACYCW6_12340 [Candidatus Xenobia bacterium]
MTPHRALIQAVSGALREHRQGPDMSALRELPPSDDELEQHVEEMRQLRRALKDRIAQANRELWFRRQTRQVA